MYVLGGGRTTRKEKYKHELGNRVPFSWHFKLWNIWFILHILHLRFRDLDFCALYSLVPDTTFIVKAASCLGQAALLEGPVWVSMQTRGTFNAASNEQINQIIVSHLPCESNSFWHRILLKSPTHPLPNCPNQRTQGLTEPSGITWPTPFTLQMGQAQRSRQRVKVHTAILRQTRTGTPTAIKIDPFSFLYENTLGSLVVTITSCCWKYLPSCVSIMPHCHNVFLSLCVSFHSTLSIFQHVAVS